MIGSLAQDWWAWIAPISLHAAALALLACLLDRWLPRRIDPRVRAVVFWAVLARLALPPGVASPWSLVDRGAAPVTSAATPVETLPRSPLTSRPRRVGPAPDALGERARVVAMAAWALGVVVCAAATVRRARAERRALLAGARPAPAAARARLAAAMRRLGGHRVPRLLVVEGAASPAVAGLIAPVVVVPRRLLAADRRAELDHALLHEAAHVRRADAWRAALVAAVHVVFWFHPALVPVRRALAALREEACDEAVARVLGSATPAYRRTLMRLALEQDAVPARASRAALGLLGGRHPLWHRLERLERPAPRRPWLGRAAAIALALGAAVTLVPMERARAATASGADAHATPRARSAASAAHAPATRLHPALLARMAAGAGAVRVPPPLASARPGCLPLRFEVLAHARASATARH